MEAEDSRELSTEVEQELSTQCKNTDMKKKAHTKERADKHKTGDAKKGADKNETGETKKRAGTKKKQNNQKK